MPIGTGIIYNAGDLILGTVSGSGTAFLETKIAAATSSIVYFDSNARINSASLNSITVGTASYVSGSTSIITNLTASNISASGTSSFGYVGIGTNSPNDLLQLQASSATAYDETSDNGQYGSGAGITITNMDLTAQSFAQVNLQVSGNAGRALGRIVAIRTASATSDLAFVTENANTKAEKMRILSDGNLGIGTTAPGAKLEISSSTAASLLNVKGAGGNGLLFVSGSGIVGIGTASPANSKLHIYADHINGHSVLKIQTITSIATSGTPSLGFFDSDGTRNTLLYAASDGTNLANEVSKPIIFSTNSTERMRIDSGGAVGIGTSTVSRILHAYVTTGPVMRVQSSGSNASIEFIPSIGHNRYNWLIGAQQNISDAFEITPSTATNGTTFTTPAILVASSGNIGIGTTSPTQRLDLSGSLRIRSAGTYSDPADNAGFINYDSTGGIFTFSARSNGGNTYMAFRTSDAGTAGERMRIINDGNVGIGTTSPSVKLHVDGFFISKTLWSDVSAHSYWGNYSTAYGRLTWDTGLAWINATTGNVLYLGADGANKHVTIATSGNVGIGTSSPQFLLDVVSTSTTPKLRIGNAGSNNGAQLILAGSNTTKNWVIANQQNLNGTLEFTQTNATGSSTVDTTPSMVINSSGNVGIGTTSPTDKLSVIVSAPATLASTSDGLRITDGTRNVQLSRLGSTYSYAGVAGSGSMLYSYDKLNIVADTSNPIIFNTGGSERVRITSGGSVGIGITSPVQKLHIVGSTLIANGNYHYGYTLVGAQATLIGISASDNISVGQDNVNHANTYIYGGLGIIDLSTSGSTRMRVGYNGDVGIGTTTPDIFGRFYTRTIGFNSAGITVMQINGTSYGGIDIGAAGTRTFGITASGTEAQITTVTNIPLIFNINTATVMTLNSTGLGIGTSSPNSKLELYSTSWEPAIRLTSTSGSVKTYGLVVNPYWATGSFHIYDYTTDNSRLQISPTGNVGIGVGASNPGYTLEVNGTQRVVGNFYLFNTVVNPASNFSNQRGVGFEASTGKLEVAASGSDALSIGRFGSTGQILDFRYAGTQIGNFSLDTNDLTLATARHLILSPSGNVGIGTTIPGRKLHLYAAQSVIKLSNTSLGAWSGLEWSVGTGSYTAYSGLLDSDGRYFIDVGSNGEDFTILQNGNVGIGTTNPVAALDVSRLEYPSLGGVLANFSAGTTDPTTEKYVILRQTYTGALFDSPMLVFKANANSANSGSFGIVRTTSNGSIVFSNVNATSGTVTAVSEKMRINSDGNVGIGTTSPATILQVVGTGVGSVGTINIKGASAHLGLTNAAGTFKGWYGYYNSTTHGSDNDLNIKTGYAGTSNIRFSTDGDTTAAMLYIKSDGNVGIGTTSPVARLSVVPSGSAFDSSNTMVAYFGKNTSNGYGSTFIRVARFDSTTTTGSNVEYTDIEQNSGGSTPFRYGTYADTNIINGAAATNGVYGSINFVTSGSTRMTIAGGTSAGNVGIGTTTPNSTLQIAGTSTGILTVGTLTNDWGGVVAIGTTNGNGIILSKVNTANDSNRVLVLMRDDTNGASIIGYTPTGTSASVGFQIRASASSYFNGGNVGIGTTSPSDGLLSLHGTYPQLNINNPSTGSGVVIQLRDNGRAAGAIGHFTSTNYLQFSTAGQTAQITLTDTGNVGIGTTSPASRLHVVGSEAYIRVTDSDDSGVFFIGNTSGFGYIRAFSRDFRFLNAAGTSLINIASGGNIGIGMTTPEAKLQTYATNTGSQFLMSAQDGVNSLNFGLGFSVNSQTFATIAGYYTNSGGSGAGDLTFYTKTTSTSLSEKMRIQADGNVGIGTTSPAYLLHVNSTGFETVAKFRGGNDTTIIIGGSDAGGSGEQYITYQNTTTAASAWMVGMDDGEDFRFAYGVAGEIDDSKTKVKIGQDGNVGIGTAAPAAKLEISGSSNSALLNIKSPISGAILFVSGSGAVGINTSTVGAYTLQVNGSFAATTKSFIIDHPTKAGKKLIYGSLESPYHGIRLTGRDTLKEGKCKVELPDYIYKLILHDSVNIQLTGIKCNKTLYVDEINIPENYFTIAYDNAIFESYKDYDFFWDFTGIRTDVPELITEL